MRRAALLLSVVTVVAGCATVSQMTATGGSRADGIVKLSFEVGMFDRVQIDEASALETARGRCRVWGYNDAEPFGGVTRQCNQPSGYGCMQWFVTREYQCLSTAAAATMVGSPAPVAPVLPPRASAPVSTPLGGEVPGTKNLGGGVYLVPAKTPSGYCIKAPAGYRGTGSVTRPAVSTMKPLCQF